MDYIVGLDIGTSGVKALAFSKSGSLLGSHKANYQVISSAHDRVEHDARIVNKEVLKCLKALIRCMGHPPLAVGIDTFMHSIMPVDKELNPLGNLLLWNDYRSASFAKSLNNTAEGSDIYRQTGTPVHPMSWLTKIKWMQEHETDIFKHARYFIGIKEYVLYKLTGRLVLDYSTASSTGIFNNIRKQWHKEALDWCGIQADRLPELARPDLQLRSITDGLGNHVAILPGLSDGCAANLGAASISPSELTLTLGTSGAIRFTSPDMKTDPERILFSYCLDDLLFVNGGASNNCYNVIEKTGQDLGTDPWKTEQNMLESTQASEKGLFYLPWMFGERAPYQLFRPLSGYIGRTDNQTPDQLLKSSIEGVLFNMKMIVDKLQKINDRNFSCLHLSGGFSNYPGIKQLTASIMDLPVLIHQSSECSALGTAYYTAKQLGLVTGYNEVSTWNPIVEEYQPVANKAEIYSQVYKQFISIAESTIK